MEELVLIIGGKRKAVAKITKRESGAIFSIDVLKSFDGDKFAITTIDGEKVFGDAKIKIKGELKFFAPFSLYLGKSDDFSFGASKGFFGKTENPFETLKEEEEEKNSRETEIPNDKDEEEVAESSPSEGVLQPLEAEEKALGFEGEVATVNYFENEIKSASTAKDVLEFIKGKSLETENGTKNETEPEKESEKSYYLEIKPSLDELFANYPPDEYLNETIPSSKWAKIDYDGEGKSYSVGILTDGNEVMYIGYGIRAHFSKPLPSSIKKVAQWVPLDFAFPKGEGYFMIYQKASDGTNV